jgi:general secretion pathway protein G
MMKSSKIKSQISKLRNTEIFNFKFYILNSRRDGFTLLEIMVVVFILALLAAIVAPQIIGRTDDARITEAKVQIKNFETALKLFKLDSGFYPTTEQGLDALIEKPTIGKTPNNYREGGYLEQKKIPLDPWKNPYIYISPGLHGDFDIICLGADGKEGGEGKDADIKNWEMQ